MELTETNHIPHSAMAEITWRCNLNCRHCYLPEGQRRKSAREADELSTAELCRVFDEMAEMGVLYLTISGGEVCMRPDFLALVAHARKRAFDLRVFTTGTLFNPKIAAALVDHAVGKVEISVYGRPETHDALVAVPGSFERSIAAARVLRRGGVAVIIKCPLMNLNIGDYPFLVALAEAEGFLYKFDPTVVPRDDKDAAPLALRSFDEQLRAAFRDPRLRIEPAGEDPTEFDMASPVCEAGRTYLALGPNGDVYPCIEWRTVLGNVRKTPLREIWESSEADRLRSFRRSDYAVCNSCELLPWCPRCTGLADREDGDFLGPSREACHLAKLNYEVVTGKTPPKTGLELRDGASASADAACGSGGCGSCGGNVFEKLTKGAS
jgi:radical SAM protein with 4Fe4S-binding SPASM domain